MVKAAHKAALDKNNLGRGKKLSNMIYLLPWLSCTSQRLALARY
jgi:hypothetical protein